MWIVRKWLKGSPDNLLSGMKDKFQARSSLIHQTPVESLVEVRFEWSRSGKKRKSRRDSTMDEGARSKRHSLATSSAAQSTTSLHQPPQVVIEDAPITKKQKRQSASAGGGELRGRRSMDSRRSGSPGGKSVTTAGSDEEHKASPSTTAEDDGNESDPEDSETPWTCTLVIRKLSASRLPPAGEGAGTHGQSKSGTVKVKIAGVVPTPHHPKVVALLKVPFPLPDIEVERVNVRKRIITPAGVARPATFDECPGTANAHANGAGNGKAGGSAMKSLFGGAKENQSGGQGAGHGNGHSQDGLILTAEEIKDVVSSTALWLVVREGFGGVGKVSRKGDGGWRIR